MKCRSQDESCGGAGFYQNMESDGNMSSRRFPLLSIVRGTSGRGRSQRLHRSIGSEHLCGLTNGEVRKISTVFLFRQGQTDDIMPVLLTGNSEETLQPARHLKPFQTNTLKRRLSPARHKLQSTLLPSWSGSFRNRLTPGAILLFFRLQIQTPAADQISDQPHFKQTRRQCSGPEPSFRGLTGGRIFGRQPFSPAAATLRLPAAGTATAGTRHCPRGTPAPPTGTD